MAAATRIRHREYELLDTGVFDDNRYFDVFIEYAKAAPDDILVRVSAPTVDPTRRTLHLLPTLWFRNTWSWTPGAVKPPWARARAAVSDHPSYLRSTA